MVSWTLKPLVSGSLKMSAMGVVRRVCSVLSSGALVGGLRYANSGRCKR
jgi:hypothetical protein